MRNLREQYDAIEHKFVDPSQDFYVSSDESDKLIKFWTDLHNAFPSLIHAAEQMARYEAALQEIARLFIGGTDFAVSAAYMAKEIAFRILPPAPEKGGQTHE